MKNTFIILVLAMAIIATSAQFTYADTPSLLISLLNQEPSSARSGDIVELRLQIENLGDGAASNVRIEILDEYPFIAVDANLQELGTIEAFSTDKSYVNIRYRMQVSKDVRSGEHKVRLRYRFDNGDWIYAEFLVNVITKDYAQIIYVDKAKLEPGRETEMKFTITNTGNAPLQDLVFSWSEKDGVILPVFSDDTKYIKFLEVGKSEELIYTVVADVNANPGLYTLNLELDYESGVNRTQTTIATKAGIFIGGETDFDVAFSESSLGQTSLSVANIGNNPALSVTVKVPEQPGYRTQGSPSAIIGNLDKGDYTLVSFQIAQSNATRTGNVTQTMPDRPGFNGTRAMRGDGRNLQVIIEYTDTTGERRSLDKSVPIQFRGAAGTQMTSQNSTSTVAWIITAIVIVIVGIIAYRIIRKRKK